jgi:hypothetical protein
MASLIFSSIQAVLVIILVWYNLSERPELRLLHVRFGYQKYPSVALEQADESLARYSYLLGNIWRACIPQEYEGNVHVFTDVANVGFREVIIHEYQLDDVQRNCRVYGPRPLFEDAGTQRRITLKIQGRHPIWAPIYSTQGFNKMRFSVIATTMKTSRQFWFYIDGLNVTYAEPGKIRRVLVKLLSYLGYQPLSRRVETPER